MRDRVVVRTGKTRNTITVHHPERLKYRITAGGGAVYLEYGTEPHVIEADSAAALRFQWPQAPIEVYEEFAGSFPVVFFKQVEHPGTSRQPFFIPSFNKHKNGLRRDVLGELEEEFDRAFA